MEPDEKIAKYVYVLVRQRSTSIEEFSAEVGISRNALYGYLRGIEDSSTSAPEEKDSDSETCWGR